MERSKLYKVEFRDNHAKDKYLLAGDLVDVRGNLTPIERCYLKTVTVLYSDIQICNDNYFND